MNDPEIEFYDLLTNNWDASRTVLASEPNFTTGWYSQGSDDPVVSITGAEESEVTGSASGYTTIKGDGTGPDSVMNGIVMLNSWASQRQTTENPKAVVHSLRNEVIRVINANYQQTQYQNIGVRASTKLAEDDQDPVMYRYEVEAAYQYTESELIA